MPVITKITRDQYPLIVKRAEWETLKQIGDSYGASRERIRQIIKTSGKKTPRNTKIDKCATPYCPGTVSVYKGRIDRKVCRRCFQVLRKRELNPNMREQRRSFEPVKMCLAHPDKKVRVRGMCNSCYTNWYYHTHPHVRKAMDRYQKERWESYYKPYYQKKNKENGTLNFLKKYYTASDQRGHSFGHC